ncbi:M16 family metallopeptidase [Paludisphaera mucosa]|uniref:Pitrilysin family protein n=1 Tax=Paludisphaera mucosa TaxID=3030827 RepID=A0ABT6FC89_9BACT|nr:pitrilysin family protein [Paludisphaera mucosa]MDG3005150.1 pitrilysin family protein [Paludisphaera mucosa]
MSELTTPPPFEFRKQTLANGLDVIARRRPGIPTAAVNLWYHVGSKDEERNQRGFAHLFEHIMFEGSEHYPGDFFKHLQPLGASINGSTSTDRTNYFTDVPAVHVERVLAMESDRMGWLVPALDDKKLDVQRDVVKNEYRQTHANRPYGQAWRILAEAMYPPQHPYSWLTIGVMEDLDSASRDDVAAFFRRYYVPANASLAIVGDIPEDEAFAMAERYFAPIPGGSRAIRPWTPPVELGEARDLELLDRVELDRCYLVWHTVPQFDGGDATLSLLGDVLGRGRSSRLYKSLVLERQWAQDVAAYQSGRELAGTFGLIATIRPGRSMADVRKVLFEEVAAIARDGVAEEELERVKTMKASAFLFALEHAGGFGGVADRLNAYNIYCGDPSRITTDLERFLRVTPDHLRAAAAAYLDGKPYVGLSIYGRKPAAGVAKVDRATPPPARTPTPFRAPAPEVHSLSNGLPVWILPKRDLPTVTMCVAMRGGAALQPVDRPGLAQLAVSMLDEGTRTRSAARIAAEVESMGASLSASCGWDGAFVSIRCLKTVLDRTLDLGVDVLREPTFPVDEWERLRGQTVAALRAERDGADSRCHRALMKALYPEGHAYRHPLDGVEAVVAGLDRDEAVGFFGRNLGPAQAGVIVAGDVDPDAILSLLEARLGDWRGGAVTLPKIAAPARAERPRILLLNRPAAPQAVVRFGHVGIARGDDDHDPLLLFNQVLGGQFTSRLNEKLREERGFTYGVRSSFDGRRGAGPFAISASLQADKLAEAFEDVRHELDEVLGDRPPTLREIDDARRSLVEGQARHFETPSALVNRYANVFIHDLPLDSLATFPERIAAVDLDSVAAATRRNLDPRALVAVVVADAEHVRTQLESIPWADLEIIED